MATSNILQAIQRGLGAPASTSGAISIPTPWQLQGLSAGGNARRTGAQFALGLQAALPGTQSLAFNDLMSLLQSGGRMPQGSVNRVLSGIDSGVQAGQANLDQTLARMGLSNSGAAAQGALALGSAGIANRQQFLADEERATMARRMSILQLFNQLVQNPALGLLGAGVQDSASQRENKFGVGDAMAGVGSILGGIGSFG